jgi:hypothetical protein
MGTSREMGMSGRGGHLFMQTNEIRNSVIHYHRLANGTLTELERVATGGAGSGTYNRSAARKVRRTPLKARVESSSHQIASFCLPQTAGTIRFPASPWATRAGLNGSTPSRRGTPSKERAEPPNLWPISPRRACCSCCTHSAPTISG